MTFHMLTIELISYPLIIIHRNDFANVGLKWMHQVPWGQGPSLSFSLLYTYCVAKYLFYRGQTECS